MAYNAANPADTQTIAAGPNDIRTNFEGLRTGQVVDAGNLKGLIPGNATGNIPVANGTQCVNLNAEKHGGNLPSAYATAAHVHAVATTSSNGPMSNTDKAKLDGIAAGAQTNQNAFSNVVVGATTIQADSATDTLTLIAGTNIALTPDATNDTVTIGVTGTVASATTAAACTGNAVTATTTTGNAGTATKLATARTIVISGKVTGTATAFDGSGNISIPVTAVVADSCAGNAASSTTSSACSGTAANATTAGGLAVNTSGVNNIANQIVRTNSSGNIAGSYFNTTAPDTTTAATSYFVETGGDGYIRPKALADVKAELGVTTAFDGGHSFAANGYQKLSNGLIIQWGLGNSYADNSYPVAFPNALFQIIMTGSVQYTPIGLTGFHIDDSNISDSGKPTTRSYIAIGN